MVTALAVGLAMQGAVVSAEVSASEVALTDTLVLTIEVNTAGVDWVRLVDPDLNGLEAIGSKQESVVRQTEDGEVRRTVRTIVLRPTGLGDATIGSVTVRQGRTTTRTSPIHVAVTGTAEGEAFVSPIMASVMERPPPPTTTDDISLFVIPVPDSLRVGGQLDVVVVAWIPRSLLLRLRTAPTMQPPEFQGAWSYDADDATEKIEERRYRNVTYDVGFHHVTVFPLTNEGFEVGRATVTYDLPLTDAFMSRELRHVVQSDSASVRVLPRPVPPEGIEFSGTSAGKLEMRAGLTGDISTVGDAARLEITLSGDGNVALWGDPHVDFPAGLNAYPEQTRTEIRRTGGVVGGSRVFTWLLVADSVGSRPVYVADYVYFHPATATYETAPGTVVEVVVGGGTQRVHSPLATGLLSADGHGWAASIVDRTPVALWLIIVVSLPVVFAVGQVRRKRRTLAPKETERAAGELAALETAFAASLEGAVPGGATFHGDKLRDRLVAGGLDPTLAAHAVAVRERVAAARYGPNGVGDRQELAKEIEAVSRALSANRSLPYRKRLAQVLCLLLLLVPAVTVAQTTSAEGLYEAGAYREAADSFAVRAANTPDRADYWFNLGAARTRLGDDTGALAAWIRAARLAPRNAAIRTALEGTSGWQLPGRPRVFPITPSELFVLGVAAWLIAWFSLITKRKNVAVAAFCVCALSLIAASITHSEYRRPVALVSGEELPLREAPYGSAPEITRLGRADAVGITGFRGTWLRVSYGGAIGWVPAGTVERI